ncbi:hypothetical protein REPUB_Repub07fG0144500 [Reevesia pubescens]
MNALRELSLGFNQLEGEIPKFFGNMCSLHFLDLYANELGGEVLGYVQNASSCEEYQLQILELSFNNFTGPLPNQIAKLSSLKELNLLGNHLNGNISENIGQLSNLESLLLGGNPFNEVLVSLSHFSNLSNLQYLQLSYSSLILKFGSDWVPPFQLDVILLNYCKLGHHFPEWLQSQRNFSVLDISNSGIADAIPNWFWNLNIRTSTLLESFL